MGRMWTETQLNDRQPMHRVAVAMVSTVPHLRTYPAYLVV